MSHNSDKARLDFTLLMIRDIDVISQRHGGIRSALKDTEGYHAVMMSASRLEKP